MGISATRLPVPVDAPPDAETGRRRELRAFLMGRRARLRPADVGLPETSRRRTPGLRREEVAQLAGLSTEWYTLFEMAKDLGVSRRTVDAVADALKLNPAERRHLHNLVTGGQAREADGDPGVDPTLLAVLDGFGTGPAMLLNARMDVIAANALAGAVFGTFGAAEGEPKNWLVYLYESHHAIDEWEAQARQLTATFRGAYCEHSADAAYAGLLERLLAGSEAFRTYWSEHEVSALDDVPPLALRHPVYGRLRFTMRVLAQPNAANGYCCFLVPDSATATTAAYRELLASAVIASSSRASRSASA
jgi:hypothetical protein